MYLEVYACELEGFTLAGDIRGWYGHLKRGWKLQRKKVGSAHYIRDEDVRCDNLYLVLSSGGESWNNYDSLWS